MQSSCAGYKFVLAKLLLFFLFSQSVYSDLLYDTRVPITEQLPSLYSDVINHIEFDRHYKNHTLPANLTQACHDAITNLTTTERFFLKDASGKDVRDWGHYEECVSQSQYSYCMVLFRIDYYNDKTKVNVTAQEEIGSCLPNQCDERDVYLLGEQKAMMITRELWARDIHANISKIYPSCAASQSYGVGGIIMFTIISILLLMLLLGTSLDFYQRYQDRIKKSLIQRNYFELSLIEEKVVIDDELDSKPLVINASFEEPVEVTKKSDPVIDKSWRGFLLCWSAIYNVEKLFVATPGSLVCLNGLRTLSMFAIILGHNYAFLNLEALDDFQTLLDDSKNHVLFQVIPAAFFAVDTFFFISGLLVTYLSLQELQRKGSLNLVLFYFHRFWRLTPVLALLMFIYWFIVPYVSSGPWWDLETSAIATTCNQYWWSTLLYIQNFIPTSMTGECMGWTWYLANDTQFYIFTPFVLYAYHYRRWAGWSLLTFLILACLGVNIFLVIYYNFTYYFAYYFLSGNQDFFNYLYIKPYARAFPWLVGIGLGFIFHQYGFKFKIGTVTLIFGYVAAFGTILFVIFFPYNDWHNAPGFYSEGYWPESVNVLFISFSRLLWSLAFAWIVWACAVGYGGPLDWFLGHPWWVLGARLTYSAYLIHPMIIKVYWASITSPMHYSAFYMSVWYIATTVLAFSFACVVFLTVERPSMNLERLILPNRRS